MCMHAKVIDNMLISYNSDHDGDYYTEAQCEAVVLCGNNHWIIPPNLIS